MTDGTPGAKERGAQLEHRKSSPTLSLSKRSFQSEKLLPLPPKEVPHFVQQAAFRMSSDAESTASRGFDELKESPEQFTNGIQPAPSPDEQINFDLKAPPPAMSPSNAEVIAEKLFSVEHLHLILLDRNLCGRFSSFLQKYRPHFVPVLARYQATQKAKAAVEYANAIAQNLPAVSQSSSANTPAALVDSKFESRSRSAQDALLGEALPAYVTHRLVSLVTDCLVKQITGNIPPVMQELVQGLAEVYCMTDPSIPDNPIVYASDEFYRATQYGRDYVIGRNCRFLQGPETVPACTKRLSEALQAGKEICETILNYRRDGTPFLNLLMMAPLYDNKGRVRYFIGCQIDVTNLIDEGRGLDSFQRLLAREHAERRFGDVVRKGSSRALGELGQMLNKEEIELLRSTTAESSESGRSTPQTPQRPTTSRKHYGMEELVERNMWPSAQFGPSGRLPGVYQNYLLVRPFPSMRITFTSPALRIPGLVQSRLMERIGAAQHIREGILEAFTEGFGVTAKISWLMHSGTTDDRSSLVGKPRWIHCTPMFGSDGKVGVWMIVIVEQEEITGSLNVHRMGSRETLSASRSHRKQSSSLSERFGSAKLYAQYLREGRAAPSNVDGPGRIDSLRTSSSGKRAQRDVEEGGLDFGT